MFTKSDHLAQFTPIYGVEGQPSLQYSVLYSKKPNELPHIDEMHFKTPEDGRISLSYASAKHGPQHLSVSDHEGKILGRVTFGLDGRIDVKTPGMDGKLVKATDDTAKGILKLTKNVLSHPAFVHAGEKAEPGMAQAIKEAVKSVDAAIIGAPQTPHYGNYRSLRSPEVSPPNGLPANQHQHTVKPPTVGFG